MRYRLTCLTPLLVGDGRKLAPIDYMVWKDQVNVLDQWRIFRLLAKGPRLDSYLNQLKNAEKLDFATWGGFAQNFAGRRIPFENAAYFARTGIARRARACTSRPSPAAPAVLICRARRSRARCAPAWCSRNGATACCRTSLARVKAERMPRRPAESVEEQALGAGGHQQDALRERGRFRHGRPTGDFKVYLLRTSTLQPRGGNFTLGWKQSPRGAVDGARPEESTPTFAEMASPGTVFRGDWDEKTFFLQPDVRKSVRWPESFGRAKIFEAANIYAPGVLALAAAVRVAGRNGTARSQPG